MKHADPEQADQQAADLGLLAVSGEEEINKMWIDQNACTYCGLCVLFVPQVFRFSSHGGVEIYDLGGAHQETIQAEAIDICPVSCIHCQV